MTTKVTEEIEVLSNKTVVTEATSSDTMADFDFSSHNLPTLESMEEPMTKSQCRFQHNLNGVYDSSSVLPLQNQTSGRCAVSPTDWNPNGAIVTMVNVSPFTANPDWNFIHRT